MTPTAKGETRLEEFLIHFGKIGADVVEQAPRVGAPSPALSGQPNCKARNYPQKAPQPTSAIPMSSAGTGRLLHAPKGGSGWPPPRPISHHPRAMLTRSQAGPGDRVALGHRDGLFLIHVLNVGRN